MSLISVLIPCHNAQPWLQKAVDSICRQTRCDLEILIYNDGSTDDSEAIIQRLATTDTRIVSMGEATNHGIVHALNTMLSVARGRYIARMDADDICLPGRFTQQVRFLESTGHDLCGGWFVEFGQGIPRTAHWPHEQEAVHAAMLFQNPILHPTVLARREVFEQFRYRKEYQLAEDYDLFSRACGQFQLANAPEVVLRYRRHPQQATQARRDRMESITKQIRIEALRQQGFDPSPDEARIHNLIRAPASIHDPADLDGIEAWLTRLYETQKSEAARKVIASQWIRACIRAAPLRGAMWRAFQKSPLRQAAGGGRHTDADLYLLSRLGLDYRSRPFAVLRRLGLSA